MADRFYGYQYDTNPRKLNQECAPYSKKNPQKNEPVHATNKQNSQNAKKKTVNRYSNNSKISKHAKENEINMHTKYNKPSMHNRENIASKHTRDNKISKHTKGNKAIINGGLQVKKAHHSNVDENLIKQNLKAKLKIVLFIFLGFSVLFAVSYQNSLISESFNKKEQSKKELEALRKTNQQIEVSIENNLNLNNIEQVAKEKLGMQKLNNSQKIYVSLPKVDYVAPATEKIVVEEDLNFFQKILKNLGFGS